MKLIGGLDVSDFLEQRHELRQIEELGESRAGAVARSFGGWFVKTFFVIL